MTRSVSDSRVTPKKTVTEHIEEESVTERIVTQIRDKIICGDLPPGTALTEAELTKAYDVSRNTLREALRQICREGLAVHYRHRGVVVRTLTRTDVRDILGAVRQPTLVMHRAGNEFVRVAHGRYLAEYLPNAMYVELPGADHLFNSCGVDEIDEIAEQIEEFLTGARHTPNVDRVLATVVFTDIVNSTVQTAAAGDRRWKERLPHLQRQ